jgi:hypothetical protein
MLLGVVALAFLHHIDHVLRADNSGWPFTPDLTPFTISLLVYPIFVLDFLLLRQRPWVRVGLVAVLFVALQVTHAFFEPPADQYGTWANGTSAVPHALGRPNLLDTASPVLGALSVAVSSLLSLAVLAALVLLAREARSSTPAGDRDLVAGQVTPVQPMLPGQRWLLPAQVSAGLHTIVHQTLPFGRRVAGSLANPPRRS